MLLVQLLLDIVLIVAIVIFWYWIFKHPDENLASDSPCVAENQTFTDPYGNVYRCDKFKRPRLDVEQPAREFDKDHYFDIITKQVKKRKESRDKLIQFQYEGLMSIPFESDGIEYPFSVKGDKIVLDNSCSGKVDGEKVPIKVDELEARFPDRGSPYAICKNDKVDSIRWCVKYETFENGECVYSNPCVGRKDGFVVSQSKTGYSVCRNELVEHVECGDHELLVNYECVKFPCLNEPDGKIVSFDVATNSYDSCERGEVVRHSCGSKATATKLGCISNECIMYPNGYNYLEEGHRPYAVLCKDGKVSKLVYDDQEDESYNYIKIMKGLSDAYSPFLEYRGRFFGSDGWTNALTLLRQGEEMFIPFVLKPEGYHPAAYKKLRRYVYLDTKTEKLIDFEPTPEQLAKNGAKVLFNRPPVQELYHDYESGCSGDRELLDFKTNECVYVHEGLDFDKYSLCNRPEKQVDEIIVDLDGEGVQFVNIYCSGKNQKVLFTRTSLLLSKDRDLHVFYNIERFSIKLNFLRHYYGPEERGPLLKCPQGRFMCDYIPECTIHRDCAENRSRFVKYSDADDTIVDCLQNEILTKASERNLGYPYDKSEYKMGVFKEYSDLWNVLNINFNTYIQYNDGLIILGDSLTSSAAKLQIPPSTFTINSDNPTNVKVGSYEVSLIDIFNNTRLKPFDYNLIKVVPAIPADPSEHAAEEKESEIGRRSEEADSPTGVAQTAQEKE